MPKHLSLRESLNMSPAEAVSRFIDADTLVDIMLDAGSLEPRITVTQTNAATWHVNVERVFEAEWPGWLKGLIGNQLRIKEERTWTIVDDSLATGTMKLQVPGQPVTMQGDVKIVETGTGSLISVDADIRASIPLFGGKVEDIVHEYVGEGIQFEITEFNNLA